MSRIRGLTSHGRILRRADSFLGCLQEELSEINASVFSTSLIELSSIKPSKWTCQLPSLLSSVVLSDIFILGSGYFRRLLFTDPWHPGLVCLWRVVHIVAEQPRCQRKAQSLQCTCGRLSGTYFCPQVTNALTRCSGASPSLKSDFHVTPCILLKKKKKNLSSDPVACFWQVAFSFPKCGTQLNGWACGESRLANTGSLWGNTGTVVDASLTMSRFMACCRHSKEARLLLLPWLLLMAGGWLVAAVAKCRSSFTRSVPAETAPHQFVPSVAI